MAYIGNNLDSDIQVNKYEYTATAGQTTFACTYDRAVDVYVNGVKLDSSDFTASNGTSITLASGANVGDIVDINAYFDVTYANFYTQAEADARFMDINEETLPTQTGQSGKFLTTNGTAASWGTVDLTDLNPTELTLPVYSSAPSSPSTGDVYYDTTAGAAYHYNGSGWIIMSNLFNVSGGTYTEAGGYGIHTFTSSGTLDVTGSGDVEYLIVAGGGSGNMGYINDVNTNGGGGGAGGYLTGTMNLTSGSVSVVVGAGGAYVAYKQDTANSGSNSAIGATTAIGGGGGGMQSRTGGAGGSGGGGAGGMGYSTGGAGTSGQGYAGAAGQLATNGTSGGGGGAGGGGGLPTGGAGVSNSINGTAITYAVGGNGCSGTGASGSSGTANRGNGGGGSWNQNSAGAGGSGIVIIRYAV